MPYWACGFCFVGSREPPEGFKQGGDMPLRPARGPGTRAREAICGLPVAEDLVAGSPRAWPGLCLPWAQGGARGAGRLSPDD